MKSLQNRKMRILIMEPKPERRDSIATIFREVNQQVLGKGGIQYEIFEAHDTAKALMLFSSVHPDLILVLLGDSLVDEGALCREIREREDRRHTGIIFMAHGDHSDMLPVECLEIGADDFLAASISPRELLARVNSVLRMKAMTDELRSANHRLEVLSLTDELTGLHNMRSFNIQYTNLLQRCRDGESGLGVIMADLDHFKSINDKTNHLVGSHVISEVGKLIRLTGVLGDTSLSCAARYGGDEYVMCCMAKDVHEVMAKAEIIRRLIEAAVFRRDEHMVTVTSSLGVAWVDPCFDGKFDDPIKAADVMLYRSKHRGKNQVNAMILRYPVDFDHVGRPHLVEEREEVKEDIPKAKVL